MRTAFVGVLVSLFAAPCWATIYTYRFNSQPFSTFETYDVEPDRTVINLHTQGNVYANRSMTGYITFDADTNSNIQISTGYSDKREPPQYPVFYAINGVAFEVPGGVRFRDGYFSPTSGYFSQSVSLKTDAHGTPTSWRIGSLWHDTYDLSLANSENHFLAEGLNGDSYSAQSSGHANLVQCKTCDPYHVETGFLPTGRIPVESVWSWEQVAPEHIIVLTHGFQPGGIYIPKNPQLREVHDAIQTRLGEQIDKGEVKVINFNWSEAFQPLTLPFPTPSDYETAYEGAFDAGVRLGHELGQLIATTQASLRQKDPAALYRPTIHFIGHSLGTVVTAEAVNTLHQMKVAVSQVTLLDTPLGASAEVVGEIGIKGRARQVLAQYDAAFLFWNKMPAGSVEFVENFYADNAFSDPEELIYQAFGQPIAGTSPGTFGLEVPDTNHRTIHTEFYRDVVLGNARQWQSPALTGIRTGAWNPSLAESKLIDHYNTRLLEFTAVLRIFDIPPWLWGTRNYAFIEKHQTELGTILFEESSVVAVSNSPSAFSMTLDLDALMGISFSYEVIGTNRGDLFATLGDDVIWSVDLADGGLLRDDVYLSLLNYSGAEKLIWLFDSPDIGSRVVFSDFNATAIVAVPEPAMLPMFLVGCTCLYRMRTRVGQSYRICPK